MSNISTIYSTLRTATDTILVASDSTYKELVDPYVLTNNSTPLLQKGYGIKIGAAEPDTDFDNARYLEEREFTIVLTSQIKHLEHDKSPMITAATNLVEDMVLLKKDYLNIDQLGIDSNIELINLGSTSEIQIIDGLGDEEERNDFIFAEFTVTINISESIV